MNDGEIVHVPDPAAHHLFGISREVLLPFFEQVPQLFEQAHGPVDGEYQKCLYATEHDFTPETLQQINASFDLEEPMWGNESIEGAIKRMDAMQYPDTVPIGILHAVPGLSLQTVSYYLHFFHHTYPMYTKATLAGLAKLGMDVPYSKLRDPEVYGLYIAALDELKDRIPFWCVPEKNIHLTRIMQAALESYGKQ